MLPIQQLETSILAAAETYANVHRGEGHFSLLSTHLYENARETILKHLGLSQRKHVLLFCTPYRAQQLQDALQTQDYHCISSADLHMPLGICALAVRKKALTDDLPFQTGGGAVKLVSTDRVIWADAPDRFEAGTPSVLHAITLARALQLTEQYGTDCFRPDPNTNITLEDILFNDALLDMQGGILLETLRETLLGADLKIPTTGSARHYTQFDNGASTPTFQSIWQAAARTWQADPEVQKKLASAVKHICADFFHAPLETYETIFTSNTTEAVNFAKILLPIHGTSEAPHLVINTMMEHHSNELPWRFAKGVELINLEIDENGFVDLAELENLLRGHNANKTLVTVCGASNVLGTFNDLPAISEIAHRYGALLMVDAAQMSAHHPINMQADGIDALAFAGHKMHAPFGSGGLIIRKDLLPKDDETLRQMRRSGEQNAAGIAALGKAMQYLSRIGLDLIAAKEQALVKLTLDQFQSAPRIRLAGIKDPRCQYIPCRGAVFSFEVQNIPYNLVARLLATQGGIGVRTGCFCAHPFVKHLLDINTTRQRIADFAIEIFPRITAKVVPGFVRISFSLENTEKDVHHLMATLNDILANTTTSPFERFLASTHNGTPWLPPFKIDEFIADRMEMVFPQT